jgi:hypothetical protein
MPHHKTPAAATLSRFGYTYDVVGNIRTWRQQADAAAPATWTYGYDAAGQPVGAMKRPTTAPQAVLQQYGYVYDAPHVWVHLTGGGMDIVRGPEQGWRVRRGLENSEAHSLRAIRVRVNRLFRFGP